MRPSEQYAAAASSTIEQNAGFFGNEPGTALVSTYGKADNSTLR
jgi:hypothetical protein